MPRVQLKNSRAARLAFWAAAVFAFVMAVIPRPPHLPGEPSDKIQHVVAFATLGVLSSIAYASARWPKLLFALSLFGAAIEIIQGLPLVHRDSDVLDWVADTVAAALAITAAAWFRRSRS